MEITFTSEISVEYVQHVGSDDAIAHAAWVSTRGWQTGPQGSDKVKGLLDFLMKSRHGCYDDKTEVLTNKGWKKWPDVDGKELFVTMNMDTNEIEIQHPTNVVHKHISGPMIQIRSNCLDILVTPDHNMMAARLSRRDWNYGLHPAKNFLEKTHRVKLCGGDWYGKLHAPDESSVVGFAVADGHINSTVEFNLKKQRKIEWLYEQHSINHTEGTSKYRLNKPSERLRNWCKQTYTKDGNRCFPREILENGDVETIQAMLDGYLMGDGSVSATGKITCSSVSRQLVDDIQEACLKVGLAAVEISTDIKRNGAFGSRPLFRLTIYRERNSETRIGWTTEDRKEQVKVVDYEGGIHCVTVPNGTLYVRRNGKPLWCGNTPYESGSLTVRVHAPIKVFREWHRHRTWSYNEESGRYRQLDPVFYIPAKDRLMIRPDGFKSSRPEFDLANEEEYTQICESLKRGYTQSYREYEFMLAWHTDRGLARDVLGVGIYSSCYCTCNPRSCMHFLELRTNRPDAKRPSKPLREIEIAAEKLEAIFAQYWPITHELWNKHGRMAP